jgi:hypothetical protein
MGPDVVCGAEFSRPAARESTPHLARKRPCHLASVDEIQYPTDKAYDICQPDDYFKNPKGFRLWYKNWDRQIVDLGVQREFKDTQDDHWHREDDAKTRTQLEEAYDNVSDGGDQ